MDRGLPAGGRQARVAVQHGPRSGRAWCGDVGESQALGAGRRGGLDSARTRSGEAGVIRRGHEPRPRSGRSPPAGKNLYTNALVALDVRTGRLQWYDQLLPGDTHDWDLTQVSPLFRESVRGRERNLIATTGKWGMLTVLDRDTHERVYEVAITTRVNAEPPVGTTAARVCPGIHGGVEWNGPAYDPRTHALYVPAVDWCGTYQARTTVRYVPGTQYLGGAYTSDSAAQAKGWLTAVDAANGTVRWRYRSARPMVAGVTATAGGVIFTGELTGDFLALDAETGRTLYRFYTGSGILGGVVTYAVNGTQYVAAASGGGSYNFGREGSPTVFVYALPPPPEQALIDGRSLYGASPGGEVTTSLPNRPCCSPNGPAVKKRAFVGPAAAPLPKARAHRPSTAIGRPSAAWSWPCSRSSPLPRKRWGSNALMWPSPKFPTSRSPPKAPKSAGASASPQGELSRPREATRRSRWPSVSKAFTKP